MLMAESNTERVLRTIIIIRRDSEANLIAKGDSLILRKGEMCWTISEEVSVPSRLKVGNGVSTWNELPYVNFNSGDGSGGIQLLPDNKTLQIKNNVISIIGADNLNNVGKSFRLSSDGQAIEWYVPVNSEDVVANTTAIDQMKKSLEDNYYNKTETDALVAKVFTFKGNKSSLAELEAITDAKIGDVWIVKGPEETEGNIYVYAENENGESYWEDFPLTVDLSNYTLSVDFEALKTRVDALEGNFTTLETEVDALKTDVDTIKIDVDTLKTNVDALETNVTTLETEVDSLKTTIGGLDTENLTKIKNTVNSLPNTIFESMEIQTLENGDMRILGTHVDKDDEGVYNVGGESILATLKAVTPNGKPGLMTGVDKAKLDKLFDVVENGGEPNVIEDIKIGGTSLPVNPIDKSVDIPYASSEAPGVVKITADDDTVTINPVKIDENGVISVPEVHIDSLVTDGDVIINGGNAGA